MNYIARDGERLDSIFFKHYGIEFDQNLYDAFLKQNYKLLLKDTLEVGDEVLIPEIEPIAQEDAKGLYGIDV